MVLIEIQNFTSLYSTKTVKLTGLLVDVFLYIILKNYGEKIGRSFKRRNIIMFYYLLQRHHKYPSGCWTITVAGSFQCFYNFYPSCKWYWPFERQATLSLSIRICLEFSRNLKVHNFEPWIQHTFVEWDLRARLIWNVLVGNPQHSNTYSG